MALGFVSSSYCSCLGDGPHHLQAHLLHYILLSPNAEEVFLIWPGLALPLNPSLAYQLASAAKQITPKCGGFK